MATKTVQFVASFRGQQVMQTGGFEAQDVVVINWTVPAGCLRTQIGIAQVHSDADLSLTFAGKTKKSLLGSMFNVDAPTPGAYSAVLTADQHVDDVNVHVTLQMPKAR